MKRQTWRVEEGPKNKNTKYWNLKSLKNPWNQHFGKLEKMKSLRNMKNMKLFVNSTFWWIIPWKEHFVNFTSFEINTWNQHFGKPWKPWKMWKTWKTWKNHATNILWILHLSKSTLETNILEKLQKQEIWYNLKNNVDGGGN